jgi:hypothetical protein
LDGDGNIKLDRNNRPIENMHFVNGAGEGKVFDVYDGKRRDLGSRPLTTSRNTRGIGYLPLPYTRRR